MTRDIRDALARIDIRLHDHIIVAISDFRSLKADGYI